MLSIITASLAGIISFAIVDYLWLAKIAKGFYLEKLTHLVTIKDGSLVPYLPAVPLVYIIGILAIWTFVLSWVTDAKQAYMYGALLGFFMYAFYDLTNLATLRGYSWSITLVDSIWGAFLMGLVAVVMFLVRNAIA
jgi:uncharacterized membrane protein